MLVTIEQYAKHHKMSVEMVRTKIKEKQLDFTVQNGITYINLPNTQQAHNTPAPQQNKKKTTVAMILALYQKENQQLKQKIVQLEAKIDQLINDKEQMLRDEMQKIEQVYSAKDEQLKSILELLNTKMLQEHNTTVHDVEPVTTKTKLPQDTQEEAHKVIELKEYLKTLDLEPYQRKVIKKRFLAAYGSDIRVIKQNGKLYLNFGKYDYSDLLEY